MPSIDPSTFFNKVRSWQWIKHAILADYLVVWARKVGSISNSIHVVDAFAGAGHYKAADGSSVEGSPIIEARAAIQYKTQFPHRSISLTCIERDTENHAKLKSALASYGDFITVRKGDFAEYAEEIAGVLKAEPALILLDPIGLKAITAERCRPLLKRIGKTDLFVIVDFGIVHRAGGQLNPDGSPRGYIAGARRLGETIDAFFGTTNWRSIALNRKLAPEEKESAYIDFYFEEILGSRYRYKCAYEVRDRHQGPIQYWLVLASRHEAALWLMNDCIVKVDRLLLGKTYQEPDQLPMFVDGTVAAYDDGIKRELMQAVIERLAGAGGSATFGRLRDELLYAGFFGRVLERTYASTVKGLVKEGKIRRVKEQRATLDQYELLTLPD